MKYREMEKYMKKVSLNSIINAIIFFYILSLYLFTYREGTAVFSNALAFLLVLSIWMNFLIAKRKLILNKLLLIQLLFIMVCLLSFFFAINPDIAIIKIRTLVLIFIVMISLINYIDSHEKLRMTIVYFAYSGFICCIYILINSDFSQITRFGSELGNVNTMGMIIGISSIFCFYIIVSEKKYWYGLLLLVMIPTILLTGSRKSLLFICVNVILIIYFRNRKSFKGIIKLIIICIFVLLIAYYLVFNVPIFYQIIGQRMENLFSFISGEGTSEGSINVRAYMIKFGIEMFKNKPFIGYGIDNYRVLLGNDIGFETYAHNNYIELMVDTGIFGVTIYYLTHIIVIRELFYISKETINKTLCYVFISIIVSYIVLSSSLIYYDDKHFSFLLALASVAINIIKSDKHNIFEQINNPG